MPKLKMVFSTVNGSSGSEVIDCHCLESDYKNLKEAWTKIGHDNTPLIYEIPVALNDENQRLNFRIDLLTYICFSD